MKIITYQKPSLILKYVYFLFEMDRLLLENCDHFFVCVLDSLFVISIHACNIMLYTYFEHAMGTGFLGH